MQCNPVADMVPSADPSSSRTVIRRRPHAKVRTGCQTCKIRRKKCDEERPSCQRCLSTGRLCDGYTTQKNFIAYQRPDLSVAGRARIAPPMADNGPRTKLSMTSTLMANPLAGTDQQGLTIEGTTTLKDTVNRPVNLDAFIETCYPCRMSLVPQLFRVPSSYPGTFKSPRASTVSLTDSDQLDHFAFFCLETSPMFSTYFDGSNWLDLATTLSYHQPYIFQAAAACGAAHRQFNAGISSQAFLFYKHAKVMYQQAVRTSQLQQTPSDMTQVTIARLLLALCACFRDKLLDGVAHIRAGLATVLSSRRKLLYSTTQPYFHNLSPLSFDTLMSRLKFEADRCNPSIGTSQFLDDCCPQAMQTMPRVFTDLQQAKYSLFFQVDQMTALLSYGTASASQREKTQAESVIRLFEWNTSYARTIQSRPDLVRENQRLHHVLSTTQNALHLLIYLALFSTSDKNDVPFGEPPTHSILTDSHAPAASTGKEPESERYSSVSNEGTDNVVNFVRLTGQVESFLAKGEVGTTTGHMVALDTAIGPPRQPVPVGVTSSSKTRHLIKSLLRSTRSKDTLWQVLDVYCIAERFSAITEYAVIDAIESVLLPATAPQWSSVRHMIEDGRLLLRYVKPSNITGQTLWVEEMWEVSR